MYVQGNTILDYPKIYAGVIDMSILGLGLYFTLDILESRMVLWRTSR